VTDGRTDGIAMAYTHYSIYAVACKNAHNGQGMGIYCPGLMESIGLRALMLLVGQQKVVGCCMVIYLGEVQICIWPS